MENLNLVCYRFLHHGGELSKIADYERAGGYAVWKKILKEKTPPEHIIDQVKKFATDFMRIFEK